MGSRVPWGGCIQLSPVLFPHDTCILGLALDISQHVSSSGGQRGGTFPNARSSRLPNALLEAWLTCHLCQQVTLEPPVVASPCFLELRTHPAWIATWLLSNSDSYGCTFIMPCLPVINSLKTRKTLGLSPCPSVPPLAGAGTSCAPWRSEPSPHPHRLALALGPSQGCLLLGHREGRTPPSPASLLSTVCPATFRSHVSFYLSLVPITFF